jgi:hypothetical protein
MNSNRLAQQSKRFWPLRKKTRRLEETAERLLAESESITELLEEASVTKPVKAGSGVLQWPVVGEVTAG